MPLGRQTLDRLGWFDPRSLPHLEFWHSGRMPNGLGTAPPADGTPISSWTDLSGNGRHAVNATAASQPMYRAKQPAGADVNLFVNPCLKTGLTHWYTNNSTNYPISWDNTTTHLRGYSAKMVSNGASGATIGSGYFGETSGPNVPVAAGVAYHVQVWVKCNRAFKIGSGSLSLWVGGTIQHNPGVQTPASSIYGTVAGINNDTTFCALPGNATVYAANTWVRLDWVTPPSYVNAAMLVAIACGTDTGAAAASGDTMWMTEALVEPWPNNSSYVDGDSAGCAWAGTAHASKTVSTVDRVPGVRFDGLDDTLGFTSTMGFQDSTPGHWFYSYQQVCTMSKAGGTDVGINGITRFRMDSTVSGSSGANSGRNVARGNTISGSAAQPVLDTDGNPSVVSHRWDGTVAGTQTRWKAGASVAQPNYDFQNLPGTGLTYGVSQPDWCGTRTILDCLIYSRKLDPAQERRVLNWLAARAAGPSLVRP